MLRNRLDCAVRVTLRGALCVTTRRAVWRNISMQKHRTKKNPRVELGKDIHSQSPRALHHDLESRVPSFTPICGFCRSGTSQATTPSHIYSAHAWLAEPSCIWRSHLCYVACTVPYTMLEQIKSHEISPTDYIKKRALTNRDGGDCKPGLIILNQPIADIEVLSRLWNHAGYRLCADGGANQLYDLFVDRPELRTQFVRKSVSVCSRASMLIRTAAQCSPW